MHCPGRQMQQGVCHRAGTPVVPRQRAVPSLTRQNKCASREDLPRSAVNQTTRQPAQKTYSSISIGLMLAYNLLPVRKLKTGIFARFLARDAPSGERGNCTGAPADHLTGFDAPPIKTIPEARPRRPHPRFPFKVFQLLAVNHLTAVSPMQP